MPDPTTTTRPRKDGPRRHRASVLLPNGSAPPATTPPRGKAVEGAVPGASPAGGDEARLVERLKAGEEAAFEELVRAHGPRMLAIARRFLPSEADAEDAFQDALLSVFRSVAAFAAESRLGTWLHRITVNAALMRLRTRSRRPETLVDDGEFEVVAESSGRLEWGVTASEMLARDELRTAVRASLDRLPEESRIVVRLRDIERMDLSEISLLLDLPLSTVKSRLRRGRSAVRAAIDAQLRAEEQARAEQRTER